jgi:tRNA threonylcarbamoyl adenosine modification protein YeaZ
MVILAIDTSVGVSVAVHSGTELLSDVTVTQHGVQGEWTAQMVREGLAEAGASPSDVSVVVVGVGPGPFTGLRVGIVTATTFGLACSVPVVGVCSLDAVAHDSGGDCVVVTDARRKELYVADYRADGEPFVATPAQIAERFPGARFVGPGAQLYPDLVSGVHMPLRAAALAELHASGGLRARPVTAMYLRAPDAQVPNLRKAVTP